MIVITRQIATRVRDIVDQGLVNGLGYAEPGRLCVEAAVCLALGLPHGDDPGCVSPSLRGLKIKLNDQNWSSKFTRAKGLRRLAVAQLGSKDAIDGDEFNARVNLITIQRCLPVALRLAAGVNPKHAADLEAAVVRCEREGTREAAQEAKAVVNAICKKFSGSDFRGDPLVIDMTHYAAHVADYASNNYTTTAADAVNAVYYLANAASHAARVGVIGVYTSERAAVAAYDGILARYAEWIVEILIAMDAPGCQYLDLVPIEVVT